MIKEALLLLFLAQCSFVLSDGGPTLEQKLLEWKSLQLSAERHPVGDIWTNCGKTGDHGKITNVTIIPDPPVIGQNITITAAVQTDEDITGGLVKLHLVYLFLPYDMMFHLCDLTKKVGHPCPIPKGTLNVSVPTKVPKIAPKGDYEGHIVVTDQNQQQLSCVDLKLTLN